MDFRFITADEREALYNEVWAEPVTTVAKRYGMSDVGLRKHCKRLGIPLPPLGYWARVKAGQQVPKTLLPKVTGDLKKYIRNYVIKYNNDIKKLTDAELMNDEELFLLSEETKKFILATCSKIQVKSQLSNPHWLITEHKEEIAYRKKRDKALKQASFNANYYSSVKSKYRDNKATLPIKVADSQINRAYRIIDTIIKAIEEMEGYASIKQYAEDAASFVVMHVPFAFELKSGVKNLRVSKDNNVQQGILILSMTSQGWISKDIRQHIEYKDTKEEPLEAQLGNIVYNMFVVANRIVAQEELEDRKLHRKWEEEERQRRLEKMREGELEEVKLLEQAASDWDKAQRIRRFADCMELQIAEVADVEKREKLLNWLKWARDKADWLDPLTQKEDDLLGKSQHIFDLIAATDF